MKSHLLLAAAMFAASVATPIESLAPLDRGQSNGAAGNRGDT